MSRIAGLKEKAEALEAQASDIFKSLEVFDSLKTNLSLYVGIIDLICKMGHESMRPRHWKVSDNHHFLQKTLNSFI